MATSSGFPLALKIFSLSLFAGVGCGYGAFKVGVYIALKYLQGENAQAMALAIGLLSGVIVGICSAITAGVLAGRVTKG